MPYHSALSSLCSQGLAVMVVKVKFLLPKNNLQLAVPALSLMEFGLSDVETLRDESSSSNDGYVALFIRMLGVDNDPQDREQAVVALWKYALGGKHCIDNIMKYRGTVNLIVNLLKSESDSACEAAAGLLRVISSINLYRNSVAESGAIEEITSLLTRSSLSSDVKEQSICTLWNLSVDEKLCVRITSSDILPLLVKFLEDEDIKVKEAAGGVLSNLTLSQSNHKLMVEAGVIPKLANLLKANEEDSKIIRKVARNALLELAKDEYNRILVMEEGLVLVPLVGAAAYKSFTPALYSWPSLPDGTKIEQSSKGPSRYGASELLLGLNVDEKKAELEEAKMNAVRMTLLPWMDAVARLVLILGLEDESAIARAAGSIADASINEHMRTSFKEAGAIRHLVQLINHPSDAVRLGVIRALDRLSISNNVCRTIEAENILHPLTNLLKQSKSEISHSLTAMFYDGTVNGSNKGWDVVRHPASANGNDMIASELASRNILIMITPFYIDIIHQFERSPPNDILSNFTTFEDINPDLQRKAASILESIVAIEACVEQLISADIESGLVAVFRQKSLIEVEYRTEGDKPDLQILELEEAGLAVSAASRLLTKLLDYEQFRLTVNWHQFTRLLRAILVSSIPLQNKEWVAACLVKLSTLSGQNSDFENPINMEVTLYETIPRAVASEGGIFPLVKMMENGSDRAVEASLAILYNLSMDSENHAAIIAAGAIPVLRKLVLSQRSQWMRALRLLRTLPT
ncbi:Junction plakoglobin [Sesamum angolense]|uniref:Junction plakoglobin n=1 Tax=Sesamum angolense TaxID=2727404 RepID=A0AAE2C5F6_9LAMI|nr:Junction plakoglobin [Sesamum angolense]